MKIRLLIFIFFICFLGLNAQTVQKFNVIQRISNDKEENIDVNLVLTINENVITIAGGLDDIILYRITKKVYKKEHNGYLYSLIGKDGTFSMLLYAPIFDEKGNSLGNSAIHFFYNQETKEEIGRVIYGYLSR